MRHRFGQLSFGEVSFRAPAVRDAPDPPAGLYDVSSSFGDQRMQHDTESIPGKRGLGAVSAANWRSSASGTSLSAAGSGGIVQTLGWPIGTPHFGSQGGDGRWGVAPAEDPRFGISDATPHVASMMSSVFRVRTVLFILRTLANCQLPARHYSPSPSLQDAAGDDSALQHLRDPARRPAEPYEALDPQLLQWLPDSPVDLPRPALLANLRRSRRGTAPGPSGYTAEIARLILDDAAVVDLLGAVAARLARAELPPAIAAALGLGRLVTRKPAGGVRGIVVGDFLRRLVATTLAQHFAHVFDLATRPHQYVLATRAGTEALAHILQLECELDPLRPHQSAGHAPCIAQHT